MICILMALEGACTNLSLQTIIAHRQSEFGKEIIGTFNQIIEVAIIRWIAKVIFGDTFASSDDSVLASDASLTRGLNEP
jgi:hypothetical protein